MRRTGPTRLAGLSGLAGLGVLVSVCAAALMFGLGVPAHASPTDALRGKPLASHSRGAKHPSLTPTALPTLTAPSLPSSLPTPTLSIPSLPSLPTLSLVTTAAPSLAPETSTAGLPAGAPASAPRLSSAALYPVAPVGAGGAGAGGATSSARPTAASPPARSVVASPAAPSSASRPGAESGLIDHLVPVEVSAPVKYIALILLTLVLLGVLLTGMALRTGRRTHLSLGVRHGADGDTPVRVSTARRVTAEGSSPPGPTRLR